jgi:hypothetical protein
VSAYCIVSASSEAGPQWIVVEVTDLEHTIFKHYSCRDEVEKICARLNDAASERRLTFEGTDRYFWANVNDQAQTGRFRAKEAQKSAAIALHLWRMARQAHG